MTTAVLEGLLKEILNEDYLSDASRYIDEQLEALIPGLFSPSSDSRRTCAKCRAAETPQWRYIYKYKFCNACYMKVKRWYDVNRAGYKLPGRIKADDASASVHCDHILYLAFNQ